MFFFLAQFNQGNIGLLSDWIELKVWKFLCSGAIWVLPQNFFCVEELPNIFVIIFFANQIWKNGKLGYKYIGIFHDFRCSEF